MYPKVESLLSSHKILEICSHAEIDSYSHERETHSIAGSFPRQLRSKLVNPSTIYHSTSKRETLGVEQ